MVIVIQGQTIHTGVHTETLADRDSLRGFWLVVSVSLDLLFDEVLLDFVCLFLCLGDAIHVDLEFLFLRWHLEALRLFLVELVKVLLCGVEFVAGFRLGRFLGLVFKFEIIEPAGVVLHWRGGLGAESGEVA